MAFSRRPPITLNATDRTRLEAILAAPTRPQRPLGRTAHPTRIVTALAACSAAVDGSIDHPNAHEARPCRWRRDPGDLVASWTRGHPRLQEGNPNKESDH